MQISQLTPLQFSERCDYVADRVVELMDEARFQNWQEFLKSTHTVHFRSQNDLTEKSLVRDAFNDFVMSLAPWRHFVTLTFRDQIGPDGALRRWRSLLTVANKNLFGKHYVRLYGHSYFSYALGIEYQQRGIIHFHLMIDRPIDYAFWNSYWNQIAGFALIEKALSVENAVRYICKYTLKGGDVLLYKSQCTLVPRFRPLWWNE